MRSNSLGLRTHPSLCEQLMDLAHSEVEGGWTDDARGPSGMIVRIRVWVPHYYFLPVPKIQ
jgi:hypothetical protein